MEREPMTVVTPIFEPEFNYLPFSCNACGVRVANEDALAFHQKKTCVRRDLSAFGFGEREDLFGIADGGRRT
jgi:hypothetical protein